MTFDPNNLPPVRDYLSGRTYDPRNPYAPGGKYAHLVVDIPPADTLDNRFLDYMLDVMLRTSATPEGIESLSEYYVGTKSLDDIVDLMKSVLQSEMDGDGREPWELFFGE